MNKETIKQTFIDLINISEVFPHEDEVIDYIRSRLEKADVYYRLDRFRNIIAFVPGIGEPILLNSHMDIPEPNPDVSYFFDDDLIRADGTNILGADPKAGLAVLIDFVCYINNHDHNTHRPIEAVITRGEESGLIGASNLDYSMLNSKKGIVLDEDGPVERVIVKAPTKINFDVTFHGKPGHPCRPESNSMVEAISVALSRMPQGFSKAGTFNIGYLNSGTARNVIAGKAKLHGELRGHNTRALIEECAKIRKIFLETAEKYEAGCFFEENFLYLSYSINMESELISKIRQTHSVLGMKTSFADTYGGSDANKFNARGIETVPIGSGYYNSHQYDEFVSLSDMQDIFEFLKKFFSL